MLCSYLSHTSRAGLIFGTYSMSRVVMISPRRARKSASILWYAEAPRRLISFIKAHFAATIESGSTERCLSRLGGL